MEKRIEKLTEMTLRGEMYPTPREWTLDRMKLFLPEHLKQAEKIRAYILAQEPVLTEYQALTGSFTYTDSVVGDAHQRAGHKYTAEIMASFYLKPLDNLVTMEWQHATADFNRVIRIGVRGIREEIAASKAAHADDREKTEFLDALSIVADALVEWAHKCSDRARARAEETANPEHKKNLMQLAGALKKIPEEPAGSFYEAVLAVYLFFQYDPDSLGTLDRTLYDFYQKDLAAGVITPEKAKTYLQELFLMIQARVPMGCNFTRGGESHFCVGGYDEHRQDVFNEFSRLILEAMTDLPTYIPQASLRWTPKTRWEDFLWVLDRLRKDKSKRLAIVGDEQKIHSFMEIAHIPFETACRYSSVGCNEVAFPGGMVGGTVNANLLHSLEKTLYDHEEEIKRAESFEEFFAIYKRELFADIDSICAYDDAFNRVRAMDTNYVSSVIFADCIETATSFTAGQVKNAIANPGLVGVVNVIDSLAVIRQLVYDEKVISMESLLAALKNNWQGYEDLHTRILKTGKFFGNDDDTSNEVAALLTDTLFAYTKEKTSLFGYHWIFGNLEGYNPHHHWFGAQTRATPDGRYDGDDMKFGLSQTGGNDREGLSALLNAVARCDRHGIITGSSSVTNVSLDEKLMTDEELFLKTAKMVETYFQNGGSQLQLNYVSAEELKAAKMNPQEHRSLRVRVSGFSDFFVNLPEGLQDDVISRTVQS